MLSSGILGGSLFCPEQGSHTAVLDGSLFEEEQGGHTFLHGTYGAATLGGRAALHSSLLRHFAKEIAKT